MWHAPGDARIVDQDVEPAGAFVDQRGSGYDARAALDAIAAAERRTRRASVAPSGHAGLVLASKAGAANELVAKLLDRYAAGADAVAVEVLLCGPGEQEQTLRDGRAGTR